MKYALVLGILALDTLTAAHFILEKRLVPNESDRPIGTHPYLMSRSGPMWDFGHSGNYQFAGCGAYLDGLLTTILQYLYSALIPIIQDAMTSQTAPSAAFTAFFKDKANAVFVAQILTNVTTGAAVRPPFPPFSNGNPTFICIKTGYPFLMNMADGSVVDPVERCKDPKTPIAMYLNPLPFILLCPAFFTAAAGPQTPPSDSCPTVNHAINRFRTKPNDPKVAGQSVLHNQMCIILEEIVHYYLCAQLLVTSLQPEVYDINKAWRLSATEALGNAVNYAYYAGSKSENSEGYA